MSATTSRHPDFESEQAFLNRAYSALRARREDVRSLGDAGGDPKASAALKKLRDRMLGKMEDPNAVCFGRLNLDDGEQYYIGPQVVWAEAGDPLVISFAAPAARPYYEATPQDPLGLELRRRFITKGAHLRGISDEVFGVVRDVEPTIADILLEELGRERTAEMREIAATIQRDQYAIISRDLGTTTIVQGGPGTGKTAVGLHRAALLLYRHPRELAGPGLLVVGPNPLFMQYIGLVLPSLGETSAHQQSIDTLVGEINPTGPDDALVARVKGDPRMTEVIRQAVVDRVRPPDGDIGFRVSGVEFEVPAATIRDLVAGFDARSTSYVTARDGFRRAFEEAVRQALEASASRAVLGDAARTTNVRQMPEFERAVDRIWPTITAPELVRQLLASEERLDRAGAGVLSDPERRLLYRKPVERLQQVRWATSDVALVDEAQSLLEPNARRYGHVVLDEAQDLTPMQLRMVARRIRNRSATVLGDLAQATGLWRYETWGPICEHLGLPRDTPTTELTHAYRVPREIMDLALPVLELTAPSIGPPQAYRESGELPDFVSIARDARAAQVAKQVGRLRDRRGARAIIAPESALQELRDELELRRIEFGDAAVDELSGSVELLSPIASKGLEFDHVIVVEPGAIIREAADGSGHQELYVALTRSMRTLTCVHSEQLPWPLNLHVPGAPGPELGKAPATPDKAPAPAEPEDAPAVESPAAGADGHGALAAAPGPRPAGVSLGVGEALVLADLRGIPASEALARALVATLRGDTEAEVAAAVLTPGAVPLEHVAEVVAAARRNRGGPSADG